MEKGRAQPDSRGQVPQLDLPAAAMLLCILVLSALRLLATNWTSGLNVVVLLTFSGALIGLALGVSRFRRLHACLLALGYSLVLLPWMLSGETYTDLAWNERLINLLGRLGASITLFFQKQPVEDTLLFVTLVSLVFWVVSLVAGYQWARHENISATLLPTWVMLVLIQVYDNIRYNRIIFLVLVMFFCLLLFGRRFILRKRREWKAGGIRHTAESSKEMNMALVIFSGIILLLAWAIPASTQPMILAQTLWERISEPWQSTRKTLGNAVAGLEGTTSSSTYDYFTGERLLLGQKAITGNATIFTVEPPSEQVVIRHYWKVRAYDFYENGQWSNSAYLNRPYTPGQPLLELSDAGTQSPSEFVFNVTRAHILNLFVPSRAVAISRPADIALFPAEGSGIDPLLFRAGSALQSGEQYRVQAILVSPTILDLRQAGSEYPDWVKRHYLQLPAYLPSRVFNLASRLTTGLDTPYDQTAAITDYLRRNIRYSKVVSRPPLGADILEWFLFDYREGYCNYYATAEVILLRSVGIPARLAAGFAQGEKKDGVGNDLEIRQKDAHAWPEVYFPGIGWVEFEPTSAQQALVRPSGTPLQSVGGTPLANPALELDDGLPTGQPFQLTPVLEEATPPAASLDAGSLPSGVYVLIGSIILLLTGMLLWRGRQRRRSIPIPIPIIWKKTLERNSIKVPVWLQRWAELAGEVPIQKAFKSIHHSLKRLGHPPVPADTPREAAAALMEYLPAASAEIASLRDEYQTFLFSRQPSVTSQARQANLVLRRKTNRLVLQQWLERLKKRFGSLLARGSKRI